ncbi:MAG: hypothetical protein R3F46_06725 [bacterium]
MRVNGTRQRLLLATLFAAVLLLAMHGVLGADPGSKEDPLATVSYVQHRGMFTLQQFRSGTSIRLGTGAELVLAQPGSGQVVVEGLDLQRDELLDLSLGERLGQSVLVSAHHYVNASGHDVFIRPASDCALLLRGEWK